MCVYIYICMCVCIYIHMNIHTHMHIHIYICMHMNINIYVYTYILSPHQKLPGSGGSTPIRTINLICIMNSKLNSIFGFRRDWSSFWHAHLNRDLAETAGSSHVHYGVATISRLLKIIGLFCRIVSFLGLFCKRDL